MQGLPRQPELSLGTRLQGNAGRGQAHPPSQDTLGCLHRVVGDFVESQVRAGKRPELHYQLDGGLGLCHLQTNGGGKTVTPGRELGASSPACWAPLTHTWLKKNK